MSHGAADLVEEVVRIVGLDKVPSAPMPRSAGVARAVLTETQRRVRRARRALAGRGLVEAITWSFIPRAAARAFGGGQDALELANPISTEMSSMRPSLLPGLHRRRAAETATAALPISACSRSARPIAATRPKDQFIAASGVRAGAAALTGAGRHWAGVGTEGRPLSTPRPT